MPDQWRQVDSPMDVGPGWKYWICRYCEAPVLNEYSEWYQRSWPADEFGPARSGTHRDLTPRPEWRAQHTDWCIVPAAIKEVQ